MDVPQVYFPPVCLRELVVGDQKFRSSCDFRLTERDLQKARTELKETDEGREVALRQLRDMLTGNWRPNELGLRDVLPLFNNTSDLGSMNPHAQIDGIIDIIDMADIGVSHLSQILQPSLLRLWTRVMMEVYPWRISRIILYNCSALQYAAIETLRRFVKKKIVDRVVVLRSDLSQLHKYVNPAILPKEYGGSLDDEECCSFLNKVMMGNAKYLEYEHSFIGSKKP